MNTKVWTCKDGRKVRIKDMTDSHLVNTIKMLERQHKSIVDSADFPVGISGEMAEMYAENQFFALIESEPSDVFPIYEDLHEEAVLRELQLEKKP